MAYKKPQIVAKSVAKQSFVAGCGAKNAKPYCTSWNTECMAGPLK